MHVVAISDFTFILSLSDLYLLSIIHLIFTTYSVYCLIIPITVSVLQDKTVPTFPILCSFIPFFQTDPGAHPASYTMGTGSFPGVKRPGRGADPHPHL